MTQKSFKMQILLLSDSLIGNAEGYGATIDKDSVFDEVGLPVIPGKRVKGILREQAELLEKFGNISSPVKVLFGDTGITDKNTEYLSVSNFSITDYDLNQQYLKYLIQEKEISRSEIIEYFTCLRMMTKIDDDGIAAETSLRTNRVLKKGLCFIGELIFDENQIVDFKKIASLTRRIGSIRNRGFGHIQCIFPEMNDVVEPEVKS
jgi:CRISPR/Cas system CSM-associated protein Csm3 (group 7 of RAMP superfamily)